MRRWILIIAAIVPLLAIAGVWHFAYRPIQIGEPVLVTIEPGVSTGEIADTLDRKGLLRSKRLFKLWAKLRDIDTELKPGRYEVSGPTAMTDLLDILSQGKAVTFSITVPEGWTTERIAEHLATELRVDTATVLNLTTDKKLLNKWEIPLDNMEGYLLPETYTFFWGVDPQTVIERMLEENRSVFNDKLSSRLRELGWTRHKALTLASMIEAESGIRDERRRISAVFHNRLRIGMPMQCDPTVVFAMGGLPPGRSLLRKDLSYESPYNTYLHTGLPPGPICNPGKAAIEAALEPDKSDELYFVADGEGGHIFSETLQEHNRASARLRRLRK